MPPLAGPRLLVAVVLLELLLVGAVLATPDMGEPQLRAAIRLTAAISLACFLAAFTASTLHRQWPVPGTLWLVRNRRWMGLAFAASHAFHAVMIVALARAVPGFAGAVPLTTRIVGGLGYVMIALMAATSNDAAVRALGPRRWRTLHVVGLYFLWFVFAATYADAVLVSPFHAGVETLLLAALALRLLPGGRRPVQPPAAGR